MTAPRAEGWIPHLGIGCPVMGDSLVDVCLPDGIEILRQRASSWEWDHTKNTAPYRIMAYRLASRPAVQPADCLWHVSTNGDACDKCGVVFIPLPDMRPVRPEGSAQSAAHDYEQHGSYACDERVEEIIPAAAPASVKFKCLHEYTLMDWQRGCCKRCGKTVDEIVGVDPGSPWSYARQVKLNQSLAPVFPVERNEYNLREKYPSSPPRAAWPCLPVSAFKEWK